MTPEHFSQFLLSALIVIIIADRITARRSLTKNTKPSPTRGGVGKRSEPGAGALTKAKSLLNRFPYRLVRHCPATAVPIVPGLIRGAVWSCQCGKPGCDARVTVLATFAVRSGQTMVVVEQDQSGHEALLFMTLETFLSLHRFESLGAFQEATA